MAEAGRADLHLHTRLSDGWPAPAEVVERAAELGLDVIAITDHDTIEGALEARAYAGRRRAPKVIIGEEISSRDGHVVGLFLENRVRPGLSAQSTVRAIHNQGGLAIAVHPFWDPAKPGRVGQAHGVGWLAAELAFDAIEVENSTPGFYVYNQMAHRLALDCGRPQVGGSDAHILAAIGKAHTVFPGRTAIALERALEAGKTRAARERYEAQALLQYAAWGWEFRRKRRLAQATGR
ncbi:MAG: PHP domain-containing protein [Candidatus Dormibacteraeota bacterium]|nr:PHP domain-containing protein [Candidatus Dormibacteraeota bacterium]